RRRGARRHEPGGQRRPDRRAEAADRRLRSAAGPTPERAERPRRSGDTPLLRAARIWSGRPTVGPPRGRIGVSAQWPGSGPVGPRSGPRADIGTYQRSGRRPDADPYARTVVARPPTAPPDGPEGPGPRPANAPPATGRARCR